MRCVYGRQFMRTGRIERARRDSGTCCELLRLIFGHCVRSRAPVRTGVRCRALTCAVVRRWCCRPLPWGDLRRHNFTYESR
jgi:hypothetical protein